MTTGWRPDLPRTTTGAITGSQSASDVINLSIVPKTVSRPRIGLLIDFISDSYQVRLVSGAVRAARRRDVDFACFVAGYLPDPTGASARFEATFVCDLAAPTSIDGLVVAASALGAETGTELVREYCTRQCLPTVAVVSQRAWFTPMTMLGMSSPRGADTATRGTPASR